MADATVSATDFKARCLDLLKQVGDHRLTKLTVTRHGKPIAVVSAVPAGDETASTIFGAMHRSVVVRSDVDLTAPAFDGPIEAEKGKLHS